MGQLSRQTGIELRQLPLTLGKVVGGLMAAIGFPAVVAVTTRSTDPSWLTVALWALVGVAGLAVFVASSRAMARRASRAIDPVPASKDALQMSLLAWALLALLAAGFVLVTFLWAG